MKIFHWLTFENISLTNFWNLFTNLYIKNIFTTSSEIYFYNNRPNYFSEIDQNIFYTSNKKWVKNNSKLKIYDNVKDLINEKRSKANLFNYKLNIMVGVPIVLFTYYQIRQYKRIEANYKEVIRSKYYDEESGCDNFNLAINIKY